MKKILEVVNGIDVLIITMFLLDIITLIQFLILLTCNTIYWVLNLIYNQKK